MKDQQLVERTAELGGGLQRAGRRRLGLDFGVALVDRDGEDVGAREPDQGL